LRALPKLPQEVVKAAEAVVSTLVEVMKVAA